MANWALVRYLKIWVCQSPLWTVIKDFWICGVLNGDNMHEIQQYPGFSISPYFIVWVSVSFSLSQNIMFCGSCSLLSCIKMQRMKFICFFPSALKGNVLMFLPFFLHKLKRYIWGFFISLWAKVKHSWVSPFLHQYYSKEEEIWNPWTGSTHVFFSKELVITFIRFPK